MLKSYKKHFSLFLMFVPAIVYFILFHYVPMYGIVISFEDFSISKGITGSPWIGLSVFKKLFSNQMFMRSVRNTVIISVEKLVAIFPAPILFALLLNEIRGRRTKRVIQTISYLPHFLSWVVLAGIFSQLLSPSNGVVNYILGIFGIKPIYFLASNEWFRTVLVLTSFWKVVGWQSIIYLAAITGIDPELYEAAEMDGASRFQRMISVTLPSIAAVITIQLILNIGSIFNAGFDQVFNLYNSAVYETADIMDTYIYRQGIEKMRYSESAAVGLAKNFVAFLLVLGTNAITKRINEYGLW